MFLSLSLCLSLCVIFVSLRETSAIVADPLCGFIAATNVESLIDAWACTSSGQTVTNPCVSPVWQGLTCTHNTVSGIVISLSLDDTSLKGTIPSSLGELEISHLKLDQNLLNGKIPGEFKTISFLFFFFLSIAFITFLFAISYLVLSKIEMSETPPVMARFTRMFMAASPIKTHPNMSLNASSIASFRRRLTTCDIRTMQNSLKISILKFTLRGLLPTRYSNLTVEKTIKK